MNPKLSLKQRTQFSFVIEQGSWSDIIPRAIYKVGGQPMTEKPSELFYCMWRKEAIPQEFKDVAIIHPYIRKGKDVTAIETYFYCIFYCREDTGQILLTRMHEHLDHAEILPEIQCGFWEDRRPTDMILSARQFQQKYQKQNTDLSMAFVDSFKAFDTVSRAGLLKIITTFGCPARFIAMVRQFIEACLQDSRTIENTLNCFL